MWLNAARSRLSTARIHRFFAHGKGRWVVYAVVLVLTVSTVDTLGWERKAKAQQPAAAARCPASRPDRASAQLTARRCKGRVEVADETTETTRVWADPHGSLTAEVHSGPVRTRDASGAWTPIDFTLQPNPDGSVSAKAHPKGLRLSGAAGPGEHALVTLGAGADAITLEWDGRLPAPAVDGTRATYANVLDGVDLVIEATRTGYEQFFVLKTRAALAKAGTLALRLRTPRLTAAADGAGGLAFTAKGSGKPSVRMPRPSMWDARVGQHSGDHLRVGRVAVTHQQHGSDITVRLAPDQGFLKDPGLRLPVTVDPTLNPYFDTFVESGWTDDQSGGVDLKLGYSDDGGSFVARSFLQWSTGFLAGTHVNDARLYLWNYHSWSCTPAQWEVWSTGAVSTATRWTKQPGWDTRWSTSTQTLGASSACNDGWVSASATSYFQYAADIRNPAMTMGLRATDEANHLSWKRFDSSEGVHDPYVVVTYNAAPQVTARSTDPSTTCATGDGRPYVNTTEPTLHTQVTDPDGSPVWAQVEWYTTAQAFVGSTTAGPQDSGTTFDVKIPGGALADGRSYMWRARGTDTGTTAGAGAYTPWCEFTVDTDEPPTAPGVSSGTLPDNTWTGAPPTYTVKTAAQPYVDGTTTLPLTGDDAVTAVDLPFTVDFFNQPNNTVWVDTDGMLFFADQGGWIPTPCCADLPHPEAPNAVLYAFTEDLLVDDGASVRTAVVGSAPNRRFVVDWHNVARFDDQSERLNAEVVLGEDGTISYDYSSLDNDDEKGAHALVGLEDQTGTQGVPYSQYQPVLADDTAVVFTPSQLSTSGYSASAGTRAYTPASTVTSLTGDDELLLQPTPFPISYYGNAYHQMWIDTNGQVHFVNPPGSNSDDNVPIPDTAPPNGTVYAFGDDLVIDGSASIRTSVTGTAPNRQYIVEWSNAAFFDRPGKRVSAEIVFSEGGDITLNYAGVDADADEQGGTALVGVENPSGLTATQYAYHQTVLDTDKAVTFHPEPARPLVNAGDALRFTFAPGGVADVASYQYGLDSNPPTSVVDATSLGGTATATITPDTDGVHKLYVRSQDRAGNQSPITTYTLNVGAGGLTAPAVGDISAGRTALAVAASPAATGVTYQWRRADTDAWQTVPAADVSRSAGGGAVTWPLPVTDGAFPKLTWNLDTTINAAEAGPDPLDGPLQIRAVFTGVAGGSSAPVKITYDRNQAAAAKTTIGPGSVNLLTGNLALSATDVTIPAADSDLTLTRTFNSRRPAEQDKAGMFGPGWVSGAMVSSADAPYTDLTVTGSLVQVGLSDGDPVGFTETTSTAAGRQYEAENGFQQLRLTYDSAADTYTLADISGYVVTFAHVSGADADTYNPTAVTPPGTGDSTTIGWQKVTVAGAEVVRPTRMLAPAPAGVGCGTLARGCRALGFTYAATTTATGTAAAQWGDFAGRVTQVSYTAWDPDASPAGMRTVVMARYSYDNAGRLRAAYDPRVDWTDTTVSPPVARHLATTYDYDADGVVTAITPSGGQQPWQLAYTTVPGDPGKGRLARVSRSALTAGTATVSVVYGVPVSGTGAPYDMSAARTTRWGQAEQPVDATAVFDADQVPDGNQAAGTLPGSYERASVTYLDANGRTLDGVLPGGYTTASWYDDSGNTVRELTAANLRRALDAAGTDDAADEAALAESLSTVSDYSQDGRRLLRTLGPESVYTLPDGSLVRGRQRTTYAYDQGAPSTGAPFDLVTTETTGLCYGTGSCTGADARVTTTGYDWKLREPTVSTIDPDGLALATRTAYDSVTGQAVSVTQPAGGTATTTPATQVTVYYRAGTGSGYAECDNHAEWAGLTCRTQPGGQPASGPELPATVSTYDMYGHPRASTEKTSAGVLRTMTTAYDGAGRPTTVTTTGTGTAVPVTRTVYDPAGGQAVRTQSLDAAGAVTAQVIRTYDTLGRATSYTDADGNVSTTTYDLLSRVASTSDGRATRTYTYDGGSERRGLPTQVVDSQGGTTTGTYDADGEPVTETWANGVTVTKRRDETGSVSAVSYDQPGCGMGSCNLYTESIHQTVHGQAYDDISSLSGERYAYDKAGRLGTVNDTVAGACTTRVSAYNTATDRTGLTVYGPDAGGGCQTGSASGTTTWTYDTASRVTSAGYTYDALGRTTTLPAADSGAAGGSTTVTYDVNDMVRTQTQDSRTVTYALDVITNRHRSWTESDVEGTVTRTAHYTDDSDKPAWVAIGADDVMRTVPGLSGVEAIATTSAGVVWQITNLRGDLVAGVGTQAAGLLFAADYTETGQPHNPAGAAGRAYGWQGSQQRWSDTPGGLVLMGARLYTPGTGRFLSVDPVYGGSANAYDYCSADSVNCSDPQGTKRCTRSKQTSTSWRTGIRTVTTNISCRLSNFETWFTLIYWGFFGTMVGAFVFGAFAAAVCAPLVGPWAALCAAAASAAAAIAGYWVAIFATVLYPAICTRQKGVTVSVTVVYKYHWITGRHVGLTTARPHWPRCN